MKMVNIFFLHFVLFSVSNIFLTFSDCGMALPPSTGSSSITDKQDVEFLCKICTGRKFKSSALFMNHLSTSHAAVEGGSYTCRYGENSICTACPAMGISQQDYGEHVTRHHINRDKVVFNTNNEFWNVLSSSVNLPAVLNNPGKGKQKDFFTRSWGVDFVDTSILPSSPHVCELPPHSFDRYLRKVRKHYVRHSKSGNLQSPPSPSITPSSSRENTPSPNPPPLKPASQKLNIPNVFLDTNFDLSNPATFNTVFSFLSESLNPKTRANPFQIETQEAQQVESSGQLLQEKLQHYIDQVEVNIAGQVANKSHHFFEVMTYHDALMSQLLALITVVRTVRQRLADVEEGVVMALKVPQMALRKQNLEAVIKTLNTIETLHKTQPTIQLLLSRQEFAGALDLIATSKDILNNETVNVHSLKHLPTQLDELMDVIEKMLLSDFKCVVKTELERDVEPCRASSLSNDVQGANLDECALAAIVSGLLRQQSYTFLEFFEQNAVLAIKEAIKEVVLRVLDLKEETTLTALVADFALIATPEGWADLLDLLGGSLLIVLMRISAIHQIIESEINEISFNSKEDSLHDTMETIIPYEQCDRLKSLVQEVLINICDQVHERLGKLVTVRSRPGAIKLVTPTELVSVGSLVSRLVSCTQDMSGKSSAGLSLPYQGQAILYVQLVQEGAKERIIKQMETEKWRKTTANKEVFTELHPVISDMVEINLVNDNDKDINEVTIDGEGYIFVDSVVTLLTAVSEYCTLADQLPQASVEIGMKTAELLKLFNSRTCQLVLGAGAVSMAGLKTITIRNLGVTLRSLNLVAKVIPCIKEYLQSLFPAMTDKQSVTISRNFDNAAKDYSEHLVELEKKIVQIVDAAINQQLANWELRPPVPSTSFKSIGKQLTKFHEAIQDILPPMRTSNLFKTIHSTFLNRVRDKLAAGGLTADNSPTHGLVVSELIFYRENLKYLSVLPEELLGNDALAVVWGR